MKVAFYVLIGGMAAAFTIIGVYLLIHTINLHFYGKSAIGKVEGYNLSYTNSNPFTEAGKSDFLDHGSYSSDAYRPTILFKTEEGKTYYFSTNSSSDTPEYEIGETVSVCYNPENPSEATIRNEGWVLPIVFIPVGLLLFFAVWKVPKILF